MRMNSDYFRKKFGFSHVDELLLVIMTGMILGGALITVILYAWSVLDQP